MARQQNEPFRARTTQQAIDKGLLARWKVIQAAKQQEVGIIRTVTLNEVLKDLLDLWESQQVTR